MERLESWVDVPEDSDFSIYNIPFGIYTRGEGHHAIVTAIGDLVLDLDILHANHYFYDISLPKDIFKSRYLNPFINLGKSITQTIRGRVQELLLKGGALEHDLKTSRVAFMPRESVTMLLPLQIANYTDFYSSLEHATNVGTMFRDPEKALLPNWKHMPVGYHGRVSSIIPSGTPIHRPHGQLKDPNKDKPTFGETNRLDFELEMGFVIGKETSLGDMVTTDQAQEHIFGMVLFNDWSARDIQVWEYVPLGPFLGKNFASSMSPWVVTLEALEPFLVAAPQQSEEVLPYLNMPHRRQFDIHLEVGIQPKDGIESVVCKSNYKYLYWTMEQQLAHHTINGCNIQVGDLYASGTISGPDSQSYGSMLELAWKGTRPLTMSDGSTRTFIEDDDTVIMRGYASILAKRVGFGSVQTRVLPAKKIKP